MKPTWRPDLHVSGDSLDTARGGEPRRTVIERWSRRRFRRLHRFTILSSERFALPTRELVRVWCRTKTRHALRHHTGIDLSGEAVPFYRQLHGGQRTLVPLGENERQTSGPRSAALGQLSPHHRISNRNAKTQHIFSRSSFECRTIRARQIDALCARISPD